MKPKRKLSRWDFAKQGCDCKCLNYSQHKWFELIDHFDGDDEKARMHVARWLRMAADHLERDAVDYPDILGAVVPFGIADDVKKSKETIQEYSVMLSFPWGG